MDAEVTFKAVIRNVCEEQDLVDCDMTFREMVECIIDNDGAIGVVEEFIVVNVQEINLEEVTS